MKTIVSLLEAKRKEGRSATERAYDLIGELRSWAHNYTWMRSAIIGLEMDSSAVTIKVPEGYERWGVHVNTGELLAQFFIDVPAPNNGHEHDRNIIVHAILYKYTTKGARKLRAFNYTLPIKPSHPDLLTMAYDFVSNIVRAWFENYKSERVSTTASDSKGTHEYGFFGASFSKMVDAERNRVGRGKMKAKNKRGGIRRRKNEGTETDVLQPTLAMGPHFP